MHDTTDVRLPPHYRPLPPPTVTLVRPPFLPPPLPHPPALIPYPPLLQSLSSPLEVDLLLIGFEGEGGYEYTFNFNQLEEVRGPGGLQYLGALVPGGGERVFSAVDWY